MKFICQKDYPHWLYVTCTGMEGERLEEGKTTTVSSSGCGLCCAVMMADQLLPNCAFDLKDALELSCAVSANRGFGTSYLTLAPALCEKLGLRYEVSDKLSELHRCLRTGGSVVALVRGTEEGRVGLFANVGHYICVIGYEPDGRLVILDPSLQPGKYDIPERRDKVELRHRYLVITRDRFLEEECSTKKNPFFLFWRQ